MGESSNPRRIVAVLGGGITGLAAAYTLAKARRSGAPVEELLIEAAPRLGGSIETHYADGFVIEAGPDSFLTEKPEAAALCRELGLGDSLIGSNDAGRRTFILHRGRLATLPEGLMLLVPTKLWPMAVTPLLPLRTKLAALAEWWTKPPPDAGNRPDESVAQFVARHYGQAMVENIADPLLAAVYGGDSARLSVRSVLPRFREMELKHGSLTRAVLRARRERQRAAQTSGDGIARPAPALFMTLREGLGKLPEQLARELDPERLHLGQRAVSLEAQDAPADGRRYRIHCHDSSSHEADALILALPPRQCGLLLQPLDPALGGELLSIPATDAITVALTYGPAVRAKLPDSFGFLAPRSEKRRMLACTFVHRKFDHRVPPGLALLRCFLGGARDHEAITLPDEEVVRIVRAELQEILGLGAEPSLVRVSRWPAAMPQYEVGHYRKLERIEQRLKVLPGVFLAGNAYSGIGISDCIRTGRSAAEKAIK